MAVYKRYKGKYLKPNDPDWDKGTWIVQFVLRGHSVKEAIPEARTRKQAEQVETQIRQAIFDRKYNKASAVTRFSDFFDNVFLPWAKENKRSWKDDEQRGVLLKEFFKDSPIRDITPIRIEAYKSALRKTDSKYKRPFAPSTINRYLQVLSRVLSMAFENGIIDSNPMERVNRLREPEPRERFLNQYAEDEEERLINALVAYGEHMVALVELDLEVGMRLGELLNAKWADVVGDVIFVMQTKNDKPRIIPLTKRAIEILRGLRQDAPDEERIFDPKRTGRRRRQLMACFQAAIQSAGLSDFHFHDLRHTFATRLRAANVHPYDIADLLGHSVPDGETRSTRVTRGYAHGVPQRLRDAVNSLEKGKQAILAGLPSVCQQAS
ncbi:MAG TPA: tyrosine-type recombinase/integrase [Pyrinomonadaceae bacterium]|nr:tyrosine-type recombinase/integrase [Pyrinomonadaceae bacterium]